MLQTQELLEQQRQGLLSTLAELTNERVTALDGQLRGMDTSRAALLQSLSVLNGIQQLDDARVLQSKKDVQANLQAQKNWPPWTRSWRQI